MAERQQDMLNALPVGEHCRCRHNVALATPERIIQGTAMAQIKQALVPDIGDYSDVPVIELLVQVGDRVSKDQGLATLESEKATMEVQAPFAGTVREIKEIGRAAWRERVWAYV